MVENLADVGSLVRRIRAERGLTQEGLARELGVSFATVNGWLRRDPRGPEPRATRPDEP
jgi:transcriptional regulator with XRE-family HTH domain